LLVEALQSLLAHTGVNSSAQRKLADATVSRNAADKKLELLRSSLEAKERRVQELEQSRLQLIEDANTRDTALIRAKEKIKLLAELVAQIEVKAKLAKGQEKISELNSQPQCGHIERIVAEGARKKVRTKGPDARLFEPLKQSPIVYNNIFELSTIVRSEINPEP
jgi:hypothetical protein